jgi:two-component system phosphate regulon sensor histidine kinase PhoR
MFKFSQFSRVLKNFLWGYAFLHLVAAAILVWVLTNTLRNQMVASTSAQMSAMCLMLSEHIKTLPGGMTDPSLPEHLAALGKSTQFRFTLIDEKGHVVADSEPRSDDKLIFADQPEILAAKEGDTGFSTRFSPTNKMNMMYLAATLGSDSGQDAGFIRVAVPASHLDGTAGSIQKYILYFVISLGLLTGVLTVLYSSHLLKPLGQFAAAAKRIGVGQFDEIPLMLARNDEWSALSEAFRQMQSELYDRELRTVKTRDRLEAVLSSMIEGVIAMDSRKQVKIANRSACRMFSLTEAELLDRDFSEVIRYPELTAAIDRTQSTSQFSNTEFETLGKPRRIISARVAILPHESQSGQASSGIVAVLHDVSGLRKLENMRREFVANVSHELKTPLTSIKACAETLRMGAINDQQKNMQFLDQIEFNANLLDQQIRDLLQLARVESGQEHWNIESISINDVCQQCILQFHAEARARNINLVFNPNPQVPIARADREGVITILNNLIGNAIHYTPPGGRVDVSAQIQDREIVLNVQDTGIGIAEEHHERIFERFYRVDRARSREHGGSGLGLAIVKHLAAAFGGSAKVTSKPGSGSKFSVHLPAV